MANTNTKTIFLIVLIMALAGYAVHMNIKLNNTVSRYEMSAAEMANRFEKVNEDALRGREELAKQALISEKAVAAIEAAKLEVAEAMSEVKQDTPPPAKETPAESVIEVKKEQPASKAQEKAREAKAKAEALLSQISDTPNSWEDHEAHL